MGGAPAPQRARSTPLRVVAVLATLLAWGAPSPVRADVVRPEDAAAHLGEEVTVEGRVANVVCSPLACLLSFSTDFSGLVASIAGDDVARFPSPRESFTDRQVRVRGTIVERNARLRVELRSPEQIEVIAPSDGAVRVTAPPAASQPVARAPEPGSDPPPAPVETPRAPTGSRVVDAGQFVARPGLPAERPARRAADEPPVVAAAGSDPVAFELRALQKQIARLEETNQALSETVAALQERIVVLEQTGGAPIGGVDPSLLPDLHPYVVAGESSRRVQHVKKGWTSERVMRAIGAPVSTVTEPNGYMTWYYPHGRAVTLDARGRVSSSIGF
jgi:hypothetical protein